MEIKASKNNFSDNRNYIITTIGTTVNIKFKNELIFRSFLDKTFAELDSFELLPNFLENLYDQKLKELLDS